MWVSVANELWACLCKGIIKPCNGRKCSGCHERKSTGGIRSRKDLPGPPGLVSATTTSDDGYTLRHSLLSFVRTP